MASHTKIYLHFVFVVKNRDPLLKEGVEKECHQSLAEQFKDLKCSTLAINGMEEHVPALIRQNPNLAPADIVKQVKGGTSHYLNYHQFSKISFTWQKGYYAASVSKSLLGRVVGYIRNQKKHHAKSSLDAELKHFEEFDEGAAVD